MKGDMNMWYPFCKVEDINIKQTPMTRDGHTTVHFEKHNSVCKKEMQIRIPGYEVSGVRGFSRDEIDFCMELARDLAASLLKYARVPGGINNA